MSEPSSRNSAAIISILVIGMLVTGASNSLWSKWQDMQCVGNCADPNPARWKRFEQPTIQTLTMFLGEVLCMIVFSLQNSRLNIWKTWSRRGASAANRKALLQNPSGEARLHSAPLSRPEESAMFFQNSDISLLQDSRDLSSGPIEHPVTTHDSVGKDNDLKQIKYTKLFSLFWSPAVCDICGTTAMNIGLLFVPVSAYQMLRGALVLWVGLFSVIFLKRTLTRAQWVALATVMTGVGVVGLSSVVGGDDGTKSFITTAVEGEKEPLVGVIFVLAAQIFTATQFVLEEKIMEKHSVDPLVAVGSEGICGTFTTIFGMGVLHYYVGSRPSGQGGYFDVVNGFHEVFDHVTVWSSSVAIMISIAFFNFCGLAVTKSVSATARSTIDTCRTCLIWIVSLYLGWETFKWLQVVGFSLLVYGTFVFNNIARFPAWTGLHLEVPAIILTEDNSHPGLAARYDSSPEASDNDIERNSRPVAANDAGSSKRSGFRRSGSGRREYEPLLKPVDA